ncbi:MAG: ATP-binding protein [Oscillospiraceae bacterium]|nr:ATP-binding protein [Oscillospiraceae bacterium]
MLCQFRFKNVFSYRDETVFDMQAADIDEFSDSLIPPPGDKFSSLLPVSAIYGPNGGGKSNAIRALVHLISRVVLPIRTSSDYHHPFSSYVKRYDPFLLDEGSREKPAEFELVFRTATAQYQYQLSVLSDIVVSESLRYTKTHGQRRRENLLFEREGSQIVPGPALKRANTQKVSPSIPYLSFLFINYNFAEIEDAANWFMRCCMIDYAIPDRDRRFYSIMNDPDVKPILLDLLSAMDIPISDYETREETDEAGGKKYRVMTTHTVNGRSYHLHLSDESEGTIKLLSMLPGVVFSLSSGGVLLVDELDAKLHPQLLRYIIKMHTDPRINWRYGQLIFTCHDTSIMKNDLLRRDEIWFAAQNEESVSNLWSLYDIHEPSGGRVKNTAAYDRQYLAGRYGADPYLRQMMDWGDSDA